MAEWTVELFRSRKNKKSKSRKEKKNKKGKVSTTEVPTILQDEFCSNCRANHKHLQQPPTVESKGAGEGGFVEEPFRQLEALSQERDRVSKLFVDFHVDIDSDISDGELDKDDDYEKEGEQYTVPTLEDTVRQLIEQTKKTRNALQKSKEDCLRMAEGVGRQLAERDREHADRVKSLEIMMKEKEKQLLNASNLLRQQLSDAKREIQMLERKQSSHQQIIARKNSEAAVAVQQQYTRKTSEDHMAAVSAAAAATAAAQKKLANGTTENLEQEVESLRLVLEMRRHEVEQLRAANNTLLLEMERCRGLELHIDEQRQRIEEMDAVIKNKNIEIRQLNEHKARLVQQLEIEESAHLSCQQDLERVEWTLQNIITNNKEKQKGSKFDDSYDDKSIILDLVHKDKSLAYSITC